MAPESWEQPRVPAPKSACAVKSGSDQSWPDTNKGWTIPEECRVGATLEAKANGESERLAR